MKTNRPKFEGYDQNRQPLWGYVNEADPYVMQMQIDAAYDHGVNVFIYDWYWYDRHPYLERCLNDGYLKAKNNDKVKFYIMWANHNVNLGWDKRNARKDDYQNGEDMLWWGAVDRKEFEVVGNRLTDKYFFHPSYYKIDGKPVLALYDLDTLTSGLGGIEETKKAFDWLQETAVKKGLPGVHLQVELRAQGTYNVSGFDGNVVGSQKDVVEGVGFHSATHYQFCHFVQVNKDYLDILPLVEAEWKLLDQTYQIPYFPHVSVGWDANPRFDKIDPYITTDATPENFKKGLLLAKKYADNHPDQPPLITINSWNEWTETSYIQPCTLHGYSYLQVIKEIFKK